MIHWSVIAIALPLFTWLGWQLKSEEEKIKNEDLNQLKKENQELKNKIYGLGVKNFQDKL